jgi:hypothetical protein
MGGYKCLRISLGTNRRQHVVVRMGRVLESLIAMYEQFSHILMYFKGFGKCVENQGIIVSYIDL